MARIRAAVAAVVLAVAVVAAAFTTTAATAAPDAATTIADAPVAPAPAVAPVPAGDMLPTAAATAVDLPANDVDAADTDEDDDTDDDAAAQTNTLDTTSRGRRRWRRRPTYAKCIVKVWEVLKAPAYYRGRRGSPRDVLLIRRVLTARRVRGGRLGRRAVRTKAWACTKRWVKVYGRGRRGGRGGRRPVWRPRYVCRYVGTPWRMCASRRYAALCGRRLRRVGRVWPAVRVRPETGKRCDADPEPSPAA